MKRYRKVWILLAILIGLTPLGLLAGGTAWGEWGTDEIKGLLGYIPQGLARLAGINHTPVLPDYSLPGLGGNFAGQAIGYYISAVVGAVVIVLLVLGIGRLIVRK